MTDRVIFSDIINKLEYIELIRYWRNSPCVNKYLDNQTFISKTMQQKWLKSLETNQNNHYYLAFYCHNPIGVCSIKYLNTEKPEWGFYVNPSKIGQGLGFKMCYSFILFLFQKCHLQYIFAKVHHNNIPSIKLHLKLGFIEYKKTHKMIYMKLSNKKNFITL